jgi:SAM-dependent methyltransferase
MWTDELFDEFYVKVNKYTDWERAETEVDNFIKALDLNPEHSILDIPCGFGRHCIFLTKKGYKVTGMDNHPVQVKAAYDTMKVHKVGFPIIRTDMREIRRKNCYDRIINFFSSFGYFDDAQNKKVLLEFYRSLKPGGLLLVDVSNRDSALINFLPTGVARREDGSILIDQKWFDPITSRLKSTFVLIEPDSSMLERTLDMRLYSAHEMLQLFRETGFVDIEIYGTDFEEFFISSQRIHIVGKKPENAE